MSRRLAFVVAHDGTDFAGWQLQPDCRTVQGVLEEALERICGMPVRLHASGRTDAGVHAEGQVAHADVPDSWADEVRELRHRMNSVLDDDVRVRAVAAVTADFHARRSAVGKRYRYGLHVAPVASPFTRRHRHHVPRLLDLEAMSRAAREFEGRRDFASLQSTGSSARTTLRELTSCAVRGRAPEIDVIVEGSGFLRHMVRALVGSLVEVGRGRRPPEWIAEALEAKDREAAGPNLPPTGLFLERVIYPDEHAEPLAEALFEQSGFEARASISDRDDTESRG